MKPNPNLPAHNFQQSSTHLNAWNIVKVQWNAMHDHIVSIKQHPIQKFHKNLKNPKNLGLKCMNAWK